MAKLYTVCTLQSLQKYLRELGYCGSALETSNWRRLAEYLPHDGSHQVIELCWQSTVITLHFTAALHLQLRIQPEINYRRNSNTADWLHDAIASEAFIFNLGLMMDALKELCKTNISEELQRDEITLHRACQIINCTIRAIVNMNYCCHHMLKKLLLESRIDAIAMSVWSVTNLELVASKYVQFNGNEFLQSI